MNYFKEFQFAKIIFIIAIPAQVLLTVAFITQVGTNPMTLTPFVIANGTFVIIYALFYGMETTIDEQSIRISYGIGLITKKIKLDTVKAVSVVSNPWYYGWGIRIIPNGMLYNISGSAGVELIFNDRSRVIRIGSANAATLEKVIFELIKRKP
ncbi:MAG: hypothetical protein ABI663_12820 [Chryseolinea sp.]